VKNIHRLGWGGGVSIVVWGGEVRDRHLGQKKKKGPKEWDSMRIENGCMTKLTTGGVPSQGEKKVGATATWKRRGPRVKGEKSTGEKVI